MRYRAFWLTILAAVLLSLSMGAVLAQQNVRVVVVNEFLNVRIVPALGADVIATVPAGTAFEVVTGRSPDNEWLRVEFNGNEGWINITPIVFLSGDINTLPVADPRTIPYGGFESPRAGLTTATSQFQGRMAQSGMRVRAGPSTGYPVLADAPRFTIVPVLGRTANSQWLQINFEGTLGWVSSEFLEVNTQLSNLPIDGILADSGPIGQPAGEDFVATLRLMFSRLDLAQPSLDSIRASWTDSALTGRAYCRDYPAQPSDYNIPNELLAAYYPTLNPLITKFNDAMFNVRKAIDLFIEVCNQPGTGNPVGQATVIGALQTIALADRQFSELREQIRALIPPDRDLGANECLFTFQNEADILPVIQVGRIVLDNMNPKRLATGYCIDLTQGQSILLETLQIPPSNLIHQLSISPFDNPTQFLAVGRGNDTGRLLLGPVLIQTTGRYLIVLSNTGTAAPNGDFALLVSIVTGVTGSQLTIDPTTGQVVISTPAPISGSLPPGLPTSSGGPPFGGGQPTSGVPPFLQTPQGLSGQSSSAVCTNVSATCEQITSCEEAYACMQAGNFNLDPDADGVPCEVLRCPSYP